MNCDHNNPTSSLPAGAYLFDHQLAGHKHGHGELKLGMLKHEDGNILKPLFEGNPRAERELSFYQCIFKEDETDQHVAQLKNFVPDFRGTWTSKVNGKDVTFLCLKDISDDFEKPSILDLKIGAITYDPEATEEKRRLEENKYTEAKTLGFRILGMRIFNNAKNDFTVIDRLFGRKVSVKEIPNVLKLYLSDHTDFTACCILSGYLHKLHDIEKWFTVQRLYALYCSSLLFACEGDSSIWSSWRQKHSTNHHCEFCLKCRNQCAPAAERHSDCNVSVCSVTDRNGCTDVSNVCAVCGLCVNVCSVVQSDCDLFVVKMIDFAHVFPSTDEDVNYLFGLRSVIRYLKDLCQEYASKMMSEIVL